MTYIFLDGTLLNPLKLSCGQGYPRNPRIQSTNEDRLDEVVIRRIDRKGFDFFGCSEESKLREGGQEILPKRRNVTQGRCADKVLSCQL